MGIHFPGWCACHPLDCSPPARAQACNDRGAPGVDDCDCECHDRDGPPCAECCTRVEDEVTP